MNNTLGKLRACIQKPSKKEIMEIHDKSNEDTKHKYRAVFLTRKLWPKNTEYIKVQFVENSKQAEKTTLRSLTEDPEGDKLEPDKIEYEIRDISPEEAIKKVVEERLNPILGLQFKFVKKNGDIRIGFDPLDGCYSLVGTDCIKKDPDTDKLPEKTMNFAWIDAKTIMHEFGHALGMIHEHQNPRGKTIDWNVNKVYEWTSSTQGWDKETTDANIIDKYNIEITNGSDYDPYSIMLYFYPPELTLDNKGTEQNSRLSITDAKWLEKMYPGGRISYIKLFKSIGYSLTDSPLNSLDTSDDSFLFIESIPTKIIKVLVIILLIVIIINIFKNILKKNK